MNEKTAYEQTIASRLQALPLPDMADAIWARIEAQLDVELPPDNNTDGGGQAPNFPTGGLFWGGVSLIVIAVLYFLFSQNSKTNTPQNEPALPSSVTTQPVAIPKNSAPANNSGSSVLPTDKNNHVPGIEVTQTSIADSNVSSSLMQPPKLDSAVITNVTAPPIVTPPIKTDTAVAPKKGRGVSGISNDDYRIVPKKDSSKNN